MKISELVTICLFYLMLIIAIFYVGFLSGREHNKRQNQKQWIEHLETEHSIIEDNKCQPYFPDFPNDQGMVIYPETGLMIIDFPDNMKIMIEQEGIQ